VVPTGRKGSCTPSRPGTTGPPTTSTCNNGSPSPVASTRHR
jgi:hypothetical protein